jgi:hypothetical protein
MVYNPDEDDPVVRGIQIFISLLFAGGLLALIGFSIYWAIT